MFRKKKKNDKIYDANQFDNIIIFPFSFFNPVPNNENTDLKDEKSKNIIKKKYLTVPDVPEEEKEGDEDKSKNEFNENLCIIKSNKICDNEIENSFIYENNIFINSNKNECRMILTSYDVHWWQKSCQI